MLLIKKWSQAGSIFYHYNPYNPLTAFAELKEL